MIGFWWFSVRWSYSPWCKWVLQRTAVPVPHLHNPAVITKGSVTGDFLGVWCPMLQHSTVVTLQHGWILHSAFIVWALQRRASVGVLNLGMHACIIQVWTCPQMPSSQKYGWASSFSISNMRGFLQAVRRQYKYHAWTKEHTWDHQTGVIWKLRWTHMEAARTYGSDYESPDPNIADSWWIVLCLSLWLVTWNLYVSGRKSIIYSECRTCIGFWSCSMLVCLRHEHLPNVACPIGDWFPGLESQNRTPPKWNMCFGMNCFLPQHSQKCVDAML